MWIQRDFELVLASLKPQSSLPIKILKGPRQVGKTSILDRLKTHQLILFDDLSVRSRARENPNLFFDQYSGPLILDEATLAPEIFLELKRRVDQERRKSRTTNSSMTMDIWITGSNQTLLQKSVQESLSGRASYFHLNTLSLHEIRNFEEDGLALRNFLMKGGWPELYVSPGLNPVSYLNDFIATFIEKDIIAAAGIEKKSAFSKSLQLVAGRIGQLLNYSDIAKNVGVDLTTVQSWLRLLEQNGILRIVQPYFTNLNQRLIKAPKLYFEDVGICTRLQGWTEFQPLFVSQYFGSLIENLVYSEVSRYFSNQGIPLEIFFIRSKEKIEIDFLIQLANHRFIAIEVKSTPVDFSAQQLNLLESLKLNIVENWTVAPHGSRNFAHSKVVAIVDMFENLERVTAQPAL